MDQALEAERDRLRALFPDTEHSGLASIMERARLSDEDLIILVSAAITQFVPLAPLVETAAELAGRIGVAVDQDHLTQLLSRPRREIFATVDERIANFARCGLERVDEWADSFRVERRMPLPRAAVLLSVAQERWQKPPKQQYVANLLEHFEKRIAGSVARGPLVRFTIGRTTPRVDVIELGTPVRTADALVNHLIGRTDVPVMLDPSGYLADEQIAGRLRRFVNQASTFRRDTGIDGRYLGFPFLLSRDGRPASGSGRARIAPVLLWPITFEMPPGLGQGAQIAFDREREEVRLNPALEGILGTTEFARWKAARDEVLARGALRVPDVMDVLSHLAKPRARSVVVVPGREAKLPPGTSELVPAAALFNAEFTGQAVAEDLRQIRGKPIAGTVLERALRVGEPAKPAPVPAVAERDRYLTVESDPSQEDAVQRSRQVPGLVVEGPPGTGKSQTIVNIVANAIGHNETVLVVCQKQAALQVVKKRLEAEGLGERLFALRDINRDRAEIVTALRAQLDAVFSAPTGRVTQLRRQREDHAARIETLEREVDRHHEAFQALDDATGLSYRAVLSGLIGLNSAGQAVEAPRLRPHVGRFNGGELATLEETCGPLARIWLDSGFEGSPLAVLRQFVVDEGTAEIVRSDLSAFLEAERHRVALALRAGSGFETEQPDVIHAWLATDGARLEALDDTSRQQLGGWLDLFRPTQGTRPVGDALLAKLGELTGALAALDAGAHDKTMFSQLAAKADTGLTAIIADVTTWIRKPSLLGMLNPSRWRARARVRALASELHLEAADGPLLRLRAAAKLEITLRPLRLQLAKAQKALRVDAATAKPDLESLRRDAQDLVDNLTAARECAHAVFSCPATELAAVAAKLATHEGFVAFRGELEAACARHEARQASLAALARLAEWVDDKHLQAWRARLIEGQATSPQIEGIESALGTLRPYQVFRARAASLPGVALQVFAVLRDLERRLHQLPPADLDNVIRRSIRREALLATKARLESNRPELLYEREELEAKVGALARLDSALRKLNEAVLSADLDRERLASRAAWEEITRLRGPRARRLREILDGGPDLGLMHLRPVWLMNPDVASRVLPLRPSLFDVVIYDEASQMPVEHAVPTLFRAKRAVISGDEKQMPPSSFFSTSIGSDEDDDLDAQELDEGVTDAERTVLEEGWNRREVKDCPDLLHLGRSTLPVTTLQIHYRSKYRELIGFSNAAFYRGDLSIPARHPQDEIRRALPIEVIRVDGVYESQTNPEEARQVVSLLERYWARSAEECPTIGVVTFNRKQADLIEDAVERRAEEDNVFAAALRRERDRLQGGEDMGFFVKNVENVQGDERDVIIFSTTFGRDAHGTFRRNFGVLGTVGGERRLNVAVTRAREKVVLVTSMPIRDVSDWLASGRPLSKPRDYLQAYLDHAERVHGCDPQAISHSMTRLVATPATRASRSADGDYDSFAEAVAAYICELGHAPVSARQAGDAFSVDFAVVTPRTGLFGLGIECDAPDHPLLTRARAREIWRRSVLARAIPVMHRVSSRDWYHHPEEERARLRDALRRALG